MLNLNLYIEERPKFVEVTAEFPNSEGASDEEFIFLSDVMAHIVKNLKMIESQTRKPISFSGASSDFWKVALKMSREV